jgi:hypothetical protein
MGTGVARFKELCLDTATTGPALGQFWAAATGCEFVRTDHPDDPGDVVGPEEGMGIAICPVPEPKTVKHRVHLDLHTDSIDSLVALGATVLPEQNPEDRWTVMADPEGGEFCAFVREPEQLSAYRVYELVVDVAEPERTGRWWADVFGVELKSEEGKDWTWLEGVPGMPFEAWVFGWVPEPKTVKNRLHWDVYGDPADLVAAGASQLWVVPGRTRPVAWTVLADPEGNEFCVFPPSDRPVRT